ncbi:class I SAM-dependent methyltransferase [Pseudonocardia benzenivorans]|uniref:Methyltransferase type 12 n=2 Tax=Pseudonocardia TaxID=1847 RepID=F4CNP2_PSEUX|nr:methyltransferase domain-containing protein [Pseudonocardia dioxanivorans]AEA22355.1 Methyltransferase type 12 [Pseudonocardia dioxanivorans CB1190]GJF02141.1 methyltransferase [Pseudonocardia sp. D17]
MPTRDRARYWLDRWDRQQEHYMPDREERFAVIADVVEEVVRRPDPLIVDLGTGPGSLAVRLLERLPGARVVGIDADPLLRGLADLAHGSDRLRTVAGDLREDTWFAALGLDRAPDAFVSTTALHWMNRGPLRALISRCGAELAPGGVFVDGDHLYEGPVAPRLDALARSLTARRAVRTGTDRPEDWQTWWRAVDEAPELADLVKARAGGFAHVVDDRPTVHDYLTFLLEAGFAEAGTVWQVGDDRVIVGIR